MHWCVEVSSPHSRLRWGAVTGSRLPVPDGHGRAAKHALGPSRCSETARCATHGLSALNRQGDGQIEGNRVCREGGGVLWWIVQRLLVVVAWSALLLAPGLAWSELYALAYARCQGLRPGDTSDHDPENRGL